MEYFALAVIVIGLLTTGWFMEHLGQATGKKARDFHSLNRMEENYYLRYGRYAERIYDLDPEVFTVLDGLEPLEIHRDVPAGGSSLRLTIVADGEVFDYTSSTTFLQRSALRSAQQRQGDQSDLEPLKEFKE